MKSPDFEPKDIAFRSCFVEHLLRKRAVSLEDGTLKHQATLFYFEPPIQLNILTFLSLMAGSDGIPHKQLCQLSDTLVGSADQTDPWVQHILYVLLDQALFCNRKLAFQSDADAQYLLEKYAYVQSSLFHGDELFYYFQTIFELQYALDFENIFQCKLRHFQNIFVLQILL